MSELLIVKPQPNFPHEDVNKENAAVFSQLLYDSVFIEDAHDLAEQHVVAFKIGHQSLRSLGSALYMDHTQQSSFSYGATIYEALSVVVRPTTAESLRPDLLRLKALEVASFSDDGFRAAITMRDHEEALVEEAPITARLIAAASDLQPHLDKRLILQGAALERDIDRDMISTANL